MLGLFVCPFKKESGNRQTDGYTDNVETIALVGEIENTLFNKP